jgi:hypothetical protein
LVAWWCGDAPSAAKFPLLFHIAFDKYAKVIEVAGGRFLWNPSFRRNLTDEEVDQLACLLKELDALHPSIEEEGRHFWTKEANGIFT